MPFQPRTRAVLPQWKPNELVRHVEKALWYQYCYDLWPLACRRATSGSFPLWPKPSSKARPILSHTHTATPTCHGDRQSLASVPGAHMVRRVVPGLCKHLFMVSWYYFGLFIHSHLLPSPTVPRSIWADVPSLGGGDAPKVIVHVFSKIACGSFHRKSHINRILTSIFFIKIHFIRSVAKSV